MPLWRDVMNRTDEEMRYMDEVRFKASDFAENYPASGFEAALAKLFSIADYANKEIIWRNWQDVLERMAEARDGLLMRRLRNTALETCAVRGHRMRRESDDPLVNGQKQMTAVCENAGCCGYVQIIPDPQPNQIMIGGTAVAMDCPVDTKYHYDPTVNQEDD